MIMSFDLDDDIEFVYNLILDNGSYSGFTFKNIASVRTPSKGDNRILGSWDDITFDNVVLGGKLIASKSDFGTIGPNVRNLIFRNATSLPNIKGTK